jgi:hypothetical protein
VFSTENSAPDVGQPQHKYNYINKLYAAQTDLAGMRPGKACLICDSHTNHWRQPCFRLLNSVNSMGWDFLGGTPVACVSEVDEVDTVTHHALLANHCKTENTSGIIGLIDACVQILLLTY